MTDRLTRPTRTLLVLAASTAAVTGAACSTFTGVPASLPTVTDTATVFAINGAPPGAPSALHMFSGTVLAADATFIFDLAFDIDGNGNAVLLPQRAVSSGLAPTHTVALQKSTETFDALSSAPRSGYRADTALVVGPNEVVVVQSQDPNVCGVSITGTSINGKVVVESIDPVARQLKIRFTVDPNCGFRSFASGVPKD